MRQDPAICGYSGCNSRSLKDREPAWKCVLGVFRAHFWASGVRWKSKSGTSCRPGCRSATQEKAFQQSVIDRRHFAIAAEKGAPGVLSPKPQGLDGTEKRGWYLGCQREWHQFAWIQVECWWASEGASRVGARLEVFEGGCEELGLRLLLVWGFLQVGVRSWGRGWWEGVGVEAIGRWKVEVVFWMWGGVGGFWGQDLEGWFWWVVWKRVKSVKRGVWGRPPPLMAEDRQGLL